MKKQLLVLAVLATVAVSGAVASVFTPAKKQAENVYTYYLEGDCSTPVYCSPEFDGAICEQEFDGLKVYSAPGCDNANETNLIIGKRPL
jgi:hypothetical protein